MNPDPTTRFSGLSQIYAKSRPDYPTAVLDFLETHCGLQRGARIVDVGSGTGISSRWLALRGWQVIGIEPNEEMRHKAEADSGTPRPEYRQGTGEATGLPSASADLVVSAQAFHWLKPGPALAEFERILKPGGWVALIWNERDLRDPFTAEFGNLIRADRESARTEDERQRAAESFMKSDLFDARERRIFAHQQVLTEEGVIGRALSMSYVPKDPEPRDRLVGELRALFQRMQADGRVIMQYETSVYTGCKGPVRPC